MDVLDRASSSSCKLLGACVSIPERENLRPAVEDLVAHMFAVCPSLCGATELVFENVGTTREPPRHIETRIWWVAGELHMDVLDRASSSSCKLLGACVSIPERENLRPAVEDLVAHMFAVCPSLCGATELVFENVGTTREVWPHLVAHPAAKLEIWYEAFHGFLDALEADAAAFMPKLEALTVYTSPASARLPVPRPGQLVGHTHRPLLQRLVDVLFERRERAFAYCINLR
ncbi:uncharacterized protein PHACADRAFT_210633 [Phanerochaete carnosa HHB-10118-sp]|uniref:Uncharacterized protein n=1 Tax=Phanerochaete carnosa (strain HHB-10118-sp) TaxID=650164 RepID=K5VTP7_PHACS|nr:uncharacterized protein PHACADRAFT_210633 [Phanerochaete carnosa HHB-10118-sp]EKM54858.1 hypothetical protein PHACADRAFT_210633 [Phanerochaete carnosa HHB-10118-sp]